MSKIPLVASIDDLPSAIRFAQNNTESRWFVASRADALKHLDDIPDDWSEKTAITAAVGLKAAHVTEAEKKEIDADVADGHEENLPSAIVDPDKDGDDDLVASKDTDHDGAAYRKSLGLKAAALAEATNFESLVAGGYYDDFGVEDAYDDFDVDSEITLTASGAFPITAAFTADQRQTYAKQGIALPDGSYPIPNKRYLKKAVRAIGRASDPDAAKAHIIKRAKALDAESVLPDDWKAVTAASIAEVVNPQIAALKVSLRKKVAPIVAAAHEDEKAALRERAGLPKADGSEAPGIPGDGTVAVVAANAVRDIEKAGNDFSEALHPRGKDGKFITKGGRVVADDGAGHRVEGTVEAIHAGLGGQAHIQIKTDQGHTVLTTADHVTNAPTAVAHLGEGAAPHANPTTPQEHLANAQYHLGQSAMHSEAGGKAKSSAEVREHTMAMGQHTRAATAHREAASQMMHSGGMTHSGEASFKPTGVETSGRHEGLATYAQPNAGTPRAGYKIPPRPEDLTPSHTGETVSPMGTSEVSKTRTADLRTEVDEFDKNPPSIRDGSAVYRARTTRYNEAKKELQSRQIPGARSGGTAGGGYNEGKNVDRDLAEDVGGKATPQLRSDTEKDADAGAGQYSADEVRAAIERGKAAGPINRSSGPVHKAMSDEQLKAAKAEGDGYAHAELVSRAMKSHPDAKTAEGASPTIYNDGTPANSADALNKASRNLLTEKQKEDLPPTSIYHPRNNPDGEPNPAVKAAARTQMAKQVLRDRVQQTAQDRTQRISNANVTKDEARVASELKPGDKFQGKTVDNVRETARGHVVTFTDGSVGNAGKVPVYNTETGKVEHVSQAEATAGHVRYGQSLGEGTPAAGQTIKNALDNARGGNHQEAVVEQLKRMGYSDRTAKGARNLTSKDKKTRITVNGDGSFGMKVNRGDGVFSARKHGVDTSGDAHSVASALHEAGKAAPAVKPHANNKAEANVLQARKEVLRRNVAETALEDRTARAGLGNGKIQSKRYESHELVNGQYEVTDSKTGAIERTAGTRTEATSHRDYLNAREDEENRRSGKA